MAELGWGNFAAFDTVREWGVPPDDGLFHLAGKGYEAVARPRLTQAMHSDSEGNLTDSQCPGGTGRNNSVGRIGLR